MLVRLLFVGGTHFVRHDLGVVHELGKYTGPAAVQGVASMPYLYMYVRMYACIYVCISIVVLWKAQWKLKGLTGMEEVGLREPRVNRLSPYTSTHQHTSAQIMRAPCQ